MRKKLIERINMRELTYWKYTVGAALVERCDLDHVLVAREVRVLHGEVGFLEGEYREVSLGVAVVIDLNRRSGDACGKTQNLVASSLQRTSRLTSVSSILNDGIDDCRSVAGDFAYHFIGQRSLLLLFAQQLVQRERIQLD